MKIEPICRRRSWYWIKKAPTNEELKPRNIKITENPIRKNIVCNTPLFRNLDLPDFISSSDIPVIYEIKAGYNGNVHGETKLSKPAPNARKIFKSVIMQVNTFPLAPFVSNPPHS